jgi:hypothetical protein
MNLQQWEGVVIDMQMYSIPGSITSNMLRQIRLQFRPSRKQHYGKLSAKPRRNW